MIPPHPPTNTRSNCLPALEEWICNSAGICISCHTKSGCNGGATALTMSCAVVLLGGSQVRFRTRIDPLEGNEGGHGGLRCRLTVPELCPCSEDMHLGMVLHRAAHIATHPHTRARAHTHPVTPPVLLHINAPPPLCTLHTYDGCAVSLPELCGLQSPLHPNYNRSHSLMHASLSTIQAPVYIRVQVIVVFVLWAVKDRLAGVQDASNRYVRAVWAWASAPLPWLCRELCLFYMSFVPEQGGFIVTLTPGFCFDFHSGRGGSPAIPLLPSPLSSRSGTKQGSGTFLSGTKNFFFGTQ